MYEGTAVDGFPADTIDVALDELGLEPDLVVSGDQPGPERRPARVPVRHGRRGTEAVRRGIPAIAGSAGIVDDADYELAPPS